MGTNCWSNRVSDFQWGVRTSFLLLKWRENFILQYLHIAIPLSNMELATCSSKLRVCCACDNLGWLVVKALDVMLLKNSDCLQTLAVNALHYTTPQTWQWHHLVHLIWQFYKLLRHWFYALLNAAAIQIPLLCKKRVEEVLGSTWCHVPNCSRHMLAEIMELSSPCSNF